MSIAPIYLLYGAIALCSLLLVEGLFYLIADSKEGQSGANRRMRMLSSGADPDEIYAKLRRPEPESWTHLGFIGEFLAKLHLMVNQAGLTISTGRVGVLMLLLTCMSFFGFVLFILKKTSIEMEAITVLTGMGLSLAIGVAAPLLYFRYMKSRRMKLFGEQLPDALDMMVRSLRVGHPISIAISLASKQMPDPIGTELGFAVDEMTYGLELREALANIGDRVDVPDFQFVVVAISIQHDTGGNLAEVLHGLSTVIRARFQMFRKIRALAAEGSFSAKVLGALPFVFGAFTFAAKPQYYLGVADEPLFLQIMVLGLVLQITGIFIMHKLINFRV